MRKPIAAAFILLTLTLSTPATARIAGRPVHEPVALPNPFIGDSRLPGPGIGRDVRHLRNRIDDARDSGRISRREAKALDREARQIGRLSRRYGSDGLSNSERAELETRTRTLRADVDRPRPVAAGGSGRGSRR